MYSPQKTQTFLPSMSQHSNPHQINTKPNRGVATPASQHWRSIPYTDVNHTPRAGKSTPIGKDILPVWGDNGISQRMRGKESLENVYTHHSLWQESTHTHTHTHTHTQTHTLTNTHTHTHTHTNT